MGFDLPKEEDNSSSANNPQPANSISPGASSRSPSAPRPFIWSSRRGQTRGGTINKTIRRSFRKQLQEELNTHSSKEGESTPSVSPEGEQRGGRGRGRRGQRGRSWGLRTRVGRLNEPLIAESTNEGPDESEKSRSSSPIQTPRRWYFKTIDRERNGGCGQDEQHLADSKEDNTADLNSPKENTILQSVVVETIKNPHSNKKDQSIPVTPDKKSVNVGKNTEGINSSNILNPKLQSVLTNKIGNFLNSKNDHFFVQIPKKNADVTLKKRKEDKPTSNGRDTSSILKEAVTFYNQKHIRLPNEPHQKSIHGEPVLLPKIPLSSQICDNCLNYLSVAPVIISNSHQKICGRQKCVNSPLHDQKSSQISLYNTIAEGYLFNCINHCNGCDVLLPFSKEMERHEEMCKFKKNHKCFRCRFRGNVCQIVQHYKRSHPTLVAQEGIFHIQKSRDSFSQTLFYPTQEHVIKINIDVSGDQLSIACKQLTSHTTSVIKKFCVTLFSPMLEVEYVSKPISIERNFSINLLTIPADLRSEQLFGAIKLHVESLVKQERAVKIPKPKDDIYTKVLKNLLKILLQLEVTCCNCKNIVQDKNDVAFCPQSHLSCIECLGTYCELCQSDCTWKKSKTFLRNFNLICDWEECKKKVNCLNFYIHKQICIKREHNCPICDFKGNKEDFLEHWKHNVALKCGKTLDFSTDREEIYWLIDFLDEMLHVKIKKDGRSSCLEVNERYAIFPNNYSLELMQKPTSSKKYEKLATLAQKGVNKTYPNTLPLNYSFRLVVKVNKHLVLEDTSLEHQPIAKSTDLLKEIITVFFKIEPRCSNCSNVIPNKAEIYFCNQSHITCFNCTSYCIRCTSSNVEFIKLHQVLDNLTFSCDWMGCKEVSDFLNFLPHKQVCPKRRYQCPLCVENKEDHFIGTKEELQRHWHNTCTELKIDNHVDFEVTDSSKHIYWLTSYVNELLFVNVHFNDRKPRLEVKEEQAVYPNNYKLELYDYNTVKKRFEKSAELKQTGPSKMYHKNLNVNTTYRLYIVKV